MLSDGIRRLVPLLGCVVLLVIRGNLVTQTYASLTGGRCASQQSRGAEEAAGEHREDGADEQRDGDAFGRRARRYLQ